MKIEQLSYFDDQGNAAIHGTADDPFGGAASAQANALFNARALHLRWTWVDAAGARHPVEQRFAGLCRAVLTPDRRFVAVWTSDPRFPLPCNGAVFNADGSLRHRVCPPAQVDHAFPAYGPDGSLAPGAATPRAYPAEMLDGVQLRDGQVLYAINFAYEWNQLRVFDPDAGTWGDAIEVYRR